MCVSMFLLGYLFLFCDLKDGYLLFDGGYVNNLFGMLFDYLLWMVFVICVKNWLVCRFFGFSFLVWGMNVVNFCFREVG